MAYDKLRDTIQQNNLSWTEIDRILLNPEHYEQLQDSASFDVSDHYTSDAPAVREVDGQEKLIYVSETGIEVTVEL
jgi:hypothetical protein